MFLQKAQSIITWTKLKIRLHHKDQHAPFFFEREIWWASLGSNIGVEEDGKNELFERPVIITRVFNLDLVWVVPLTSKLKNGKFYFPFVHEGKTYSAILSQMKPLSTKRLIRKIRTISLNDFVEMKNRLQILL